MRIRLLSISPSEQLQQHPNLLNPLTPAAPCSCRGDYLGSKDAVRARSPDRQRSLLPRCDHPGSMQTALERTPERFTATALSLASGRHRRGCDEGESDRSSLLVKTNILGKNIFPTVTYWGKIFSSRCQCSSASGPPRPSTMTPAARAGASTSELCL